MIGRFFKTQAPVIGQTLSLVTLGLFILFLFSKPYVLLLSLEDINAEIQNEKIVYRDVLHNLHIDMNTAVVGIEGENTLRILSHGRVTNLRENQNQNVGVLSRATLTQQGQTLTLSVRDHLHATICENTSDSVDAALRDPFSHPLCTQHPISSAHRDNSTLGRTLLINDMRLNGMIAQNITPRSWTETLFGSQMTEIRRQNNTLLVFMSPKPWIQNLAGRETIILLCALAGLLLGGHFTQRLKAKHRKSTKKDS